MANRIPQIGATNVERMVIFEQQKSKNKQDKRQDVLRLTAADYSRLRTGLSLTF